MSHERPGEVAPCNPPVPRDPWAIGTRRVPRGRLLDNPKLLGYLGRRAIRFVHYSASYGELLDVPPYLCRGASVSQPSLGRSVLPAGPSRRDLSCSRRSGRNPSVVAWWWGVYVLDCWAGWGAGS